MKLINGTIRPGTVLKVLENGNIKASAPGLFSFTDEVDKLPPIMPWFMGSNSKSFSKVKEYDEVWIMNFSDNPLQLYWLRKDDIDCPNIPMNEDNVEILCNRNVNGEWCSIYFSDGSGWVISKGGSSIKIKADGSIVLPNGINRCIDINGSNISIGSEGKSAHPAAYGDKVEEALMQISILLNNLALKVGIVYPAVSESILSQLPAVTQKITGISSKNVTID
jgi:hypothetical protein